MFHVTKELSFCYGHRLLDYEGKCAHPHGHNGLVQVEFASEQLDHRGMVVDFVDIKKYVKAFLDEKLDHQMILRKDDPLVKVLQEMGEPIFLMEENPTAENIAKEIFLAAKAQNLPIRSVKLWETPSSVAEYRE